jgi:hypothetical protein
MDAALANRTTALVQEGRRAKSRLRFGPPIQLEINSCVLAVAWHDIMMSEERRSEGARLLLAILARRRKVPEATERRPAGGGEEAEKLCLFVLSKLAHQLDDAQTKTR